MKLTQHIVISLVASGLVYMALRSVACALAYAAADLAFFALTGIRDGAALGLKLRHVDLADCSIRQDARYSATKFSKSMTTWFFPVQGEAEAVFADYVRFLREEEFWSPDDPLFPRTKIGTDPEGGFTAVGFDRAQ